MPPEITLMQITPVGVTGSSSKCSIPPCVQTVSLAKPAYTITISINLGRSIVEHSGTLFQAKQYIKHLLCIIIS